MADNIPNFVPSPDTKSVKDGPWPDSATWSAGVPTATSGVSIGHRVTVAGDAIARAVRVEHGSLAFNPGVDSQLMVQTLQVEHGGLEMGTAAAPMKQVGEIVFRDLPLEDPEQFGNGLLVQHGSTVSIYGGGLVTLKSENPAGVRGHTLFTEDADVRIHGATFADLGRTFGDPLDPVTNHIGRYAVHLHHLRGLPDLLGSPQFEFVGCQVLRSRKWGLAIHDSHCGLVTDNLFDGGRGAGIAFEFGNEFGNIVSRNTVRNITAGTHLDKFELGAIRDGDSDGAGIWGRSVSNDVTENVVEDCALGISFWARINALLPFPDAPGIFSDYPAYSGFLSGLPTHPGITYDFASRQRGFHFARNMARRCPVAYTLSGIAQGRTGKFVTPRTTFHSTDNHAEGCPFGYEINYSGDLILSGTVKQPAMLLKKLSFTPPPDATELFLVD